MLWSILKNGDLLLPSSVDGVCLSEFHGISHCASCVSTDFLLPSNWGKLSYICILYPKKCKSYHHVYITVNRTWNQCHEMSVDGSLCIPTVLRFLLLLTPTPKHASSKVWIFKQWWLKALNWSYIRKAHSNWIVPGFCTVIHDLSALTGKLTHLCERCLLCLCHAENIPAVKHVAVSTEYIGKTIKAITFTVHVIFSWQRPSWFETPSSCCMSEIAFLWNFSNFSIMFSIVCGNALFLLFFLLSLSI